MDYGGLGGCLEVGGLAGAGGGVMGGDITIKFSGFS